MPNEHYAPAVTTGFIGDDSHAQAATAVAWLRDSRQTLETAVHGALQRLIYSNRSYLRPTMFKPLAAAEIDQVIRFAVESDCEAVIALARKRAKEGLGSGVLMTILKTVFEACQQHLSNEQLVEAISILNNYQSIYLEAYIETRENVVLAEQEHIRSALQGSFHRYYTWLQTAAEVSKAVTSTLDLRQLISEAVNLIRNHFDHHYVALYLLDKKYAVLRASSSSDKQDIPRAGQKVRVGDASLVGQCAATGESRTVANTASDILHSDQTVLSQTKSVMVLPLISRRRIIGVISIQSARASAFYDDDVTRMQTVADQLANAVENARLYYELQVHSQHLAQAVELRTLELVKTTERVEAILNNSPDAILLFNKDWQIELANPAAYETFGYAAEEMLNASLEDIFTQDANGALPKLLQDCAQNGQARSTSMVALRRDQSTFDAGVALAAIYEDHSMTGLVCIVRDITEQIQAEAQIKASLREKEVLLREIHHRVKNNMQVMSSLIALQSSYTDDDRVHQMFYESQSRIRSMALVHEQLYRSNDMAHIDFAKYIGDLTFNLIRTYQNTIGRVKLQTNCDPIYLDIDTAIPCGLIINELVSNALKHAFPDGREGVIEVEFRLDQDHALILIVRDNGVGFPKGLNVQKTDTLGLQLVSSLTSQLNATIGLQQEGGTTFEIRFVRPAQTASEIHQIVRSKTSTAV